MRVGTWNLEGRRGEAQADLLRAQDCDIWLLTEVNDRFELPGLHLHRGAGAMQPGKRWVAAVVDGWTVVSSILPWRSCGGDPPWEGAGHADRTSATLTALRPSLAAADRLAWGGDWNHALVGREFTGSVGGRRHLQALLGELGLHVPTPGLAHRSSGLFSIDHVALPADRPVTGAWRVVAEAGGRRLSDHDACVDELAGGTNPPASGHHGEQPPVE